MILGGSLTNKIEIFVVAGSDMRSSSNTRNVTFLGPACGSSAVFLYRVFTRVYLKSMREAGPVITSVHVVVLYQRCVLAGADGSVESSSSGEQGSTYRREGILNMDTIYNNGVLTHTYVYLVVVVYSLW